VARFTPAGIALAPGWVQYVLIAVG